MDGAVSEVGGDSVAGLEVMDGADDAAVLGEEAVAHAVDTGGVAGFESMFQEFDPMVAQEELSVRRSTESGEEFVDTLALGLHAMDEPFGDGGRCLEGLVGDEVEDRDVACVADTGEDGEVELGADGAELVIIKTAQICCRSSAADNYDSIKTLYFF